MFKKADVNLLWYLIGIVLAIFLVILIYKFGSKLVGILVQ